MTVNWKTTLAGLILISVAIYKIIHGGGSVSEADIGMIFSGVGLLAAKDHNVTGGSVQQ